MSLRLRGWAVSAPWGLAAFAFADGRAARKEATRLRGQASAERDRADALSLQASEREAVLRERAQADAVVAWVDLRALEPGRVGRK